MVDKNKQLLNYNRNMFKGDIILEKVIYNKVPYYKDRNNNLFDNNVQFVGFMVYNKYIFFNNSNEDYNLNCDKYINAFK